MKTVKISLHLDRH